MTSTHILTGFLVIVGLILAGLFLRWLWNLGKELLDGMSNDPDDHKDDDFMKSIDDKD